MCITLRGKKFHYRFQFQGADYSGVCEGCEIPPDASPKDVAALRKKAVQFETNEKSRVAREVKEKADIEKEIRKNKSVVALIENYKFELSGGRPITFSEAFALAAAKPSRRKAVSSYASLRETYWNDFSAFMEQTYPEVKDLSAVRRAHCEAYISYITDNGRFVKEVKYSLTTGRKRTRDISYSCDYKLSHKTVKEIVGVCRWVFAKLEEDAGIVRDPWKEVVLPAGEVIDREVFTAEELRIIWEGMQSNPFCYHLFIIAANSGMTEGDICTLEWADIDFNSPVPGIRRKRRKTNTWISLPMMPQLRQYLSLLPRNGKYVSPVHAGMYLHQQSCVSARVTTFLKGLGIETTVKVEGRRARSVKDLHSMRHVFCHRAKRAGIPESSIMQMIGHNVIATTQHYADHDTIEDLAEDIKKLPALFTGEFAPDARRELAELAYSLPLEEVERLLATARVKALPEPVCS